MAEFELIVRENFDAVRVFNDPEGIDKILKGIEEKVTGIVPDLSTDKGRKEIASTSYKVRQSKTLLISEGKKLTEDWRTKTKKVNDDCKKIETFCDTLAEKVREPLTNWQLAEESRIKAEAEAIKYASDWDAAHKEHELYLRMKDLERKEAELEAMKKAQKDEADRIEAERLAKEKADREAEEARQAEIARKQQAEIEEANRLAREKRIAEEAAAKAKKDAEEKAEAERKATEQRLIDAEAKRISDLAAERAKADAEKKALADAQEKARIEAERKRLADIQAEKDKAEAEKRVMIESQAKKDREAAEALKAEQARIKTDKDAEEKRQKNVAHQKKINNEALNSLIAIDIDMADAKRIVEAIIKGQIANVFIKY